MACLRSSKPLPATLTVIVPCQRGARRIAQRAGANSTDEYDGECDDGEGWKRGTRSWKPPSKRPTKCGRATADRRRTLRAARSGDKTTKAAVLPMARFGPTSAPPLAAQVPRARMRPRASLSRRPSRFVEGDCRLPEARRAHGAALGTRGRPARAPPCASRARQRLRVQVRDRIVATDRSTPPRRRRLLRPARSDPAVGADEVDRRPAVHEPEHRSGKRVLRGRPHRRSDGRSLQDRRPSRHLTDVGDDVQADDQGRRARSRASWECGTSWKAACAEPATGCGSPLS